MWFLIFLLQKIKNEKKTKTNLKHSAGFFTATLPPTADKHERGSATVVSGTVALNGDTIAEIDSFKSWGKYFVCFHWSNVRCAVGNPLKCGQLDVFDLMRHPPSCLCQSSRNCWTRSTFGYDLAVSQWMPTDICLKMASFSHWARSGCSSDRWQTDRQLSRASRASHGQPQLSRHKLSAALQKIMHETRLWLQCSTHENPTQNPAGELFLLVRPVNSNAENIKAALVALSPAFHSFHMGELWAMNLCRVIAASWHLRAPTTSINLNRIWN